MAYLNKLAQNIKNITKSESESNIGFIMNIGDGIAYANGLSQVKYNEIVEIEINEDKRILALAFNLEEELTGLLILEEFSEVYQGAKVIATGDILSINVNDSVLSRVLDPLGRSLDGKQDILASESKEMQLEKMAPGVITRQSVTRPLQTGILVVDSLVNVGRGQRQLIIGDRQTGKTSIAIDTILNQKGKDCICVYVSIGQKQSKLKQIVEKLQGKGAMDYTVVVSSSSSEPVALQYLAPYAGIAIAEYFMDLGKDVLVIYDDLTKHAWAYRQLSLLFRRPPGREAYPGDVFYLHSRLLERSAQLNTNFGGGSITALPIIETLAGDVSGYIPTNVISITDGQIYLEAELFNAGIRPAVNPGLSVTRVGGAAQPKNLKKVAGSMKLELAQYRELAAFAKFGGDLDKNTQEKLTRGAILTQILIQPPGAPYSLSQEVIITFAGTKGYLDDLSLTKVNEWIKDLLKFIADYHTSIMETLDQGSWSDEISNNLSEIIKEFKSQHTI